MWLAPEEPEAGPWRVERLAVAVEALTRLGGSASAAGRPVVLAVDGRSSSGKTTLAARIGNTVAGSAIVHTDDIAWSHSRFGWADLLIDGILTVVRQGEPVAYRPPRWADHGREGCITVPAGCPLLIVEGVGCRRGPSLGTRRHRGLGCPGNLLRPDHRNRRRWLLARPTTRPSRLLFRDGHLQPRDFHSIGVGGRANRSLWLHHHTVTPQQARAANLTLRADTCEAGTGHTCPGLRRESSERPRATDLPSRSCDQSRSRAPSVTRVWVRSPPADYIPPSLRAYRTP